MEDEVVACLPCGIGVRVLRWVMRGRSLGVEEMEMEMGRVGDGDGDGDGDEAGGGWRWR